MMENYSRKITNELKAKGYKTGNILARADLQRVFMIDA